MKRSKVERILGDFRRGVPILLYEGQEFLLCAATETYQIDNNINIFSDFFVDDGNKARVVLTKERVNYILTSELEFGEEELYRICIDFHEASTIGNMIAGHYTVSSSDVFEKTSNLDKYAIKLAKTAELLPSVIVLDRMFPCQEKMISWCNKNDVLYISADEVGAYIADNTLTEVCRSPLMLEAGPAEIVIYRPNSGLFEHYAIIVGSPDFSNPLVRLHSSCYTGDLLASLSCDCRPQLHHAIARMSESGGGIVLYMLQEGRGIGLASKIRTYAQQKLFGIDTADANEIIGFKYDERDMSCAAEILKHLKIKQIRLMTNNSKKCQSLRNCGIEITNIVPLQVKCNRHNIDYMRTKAEKFGHALEINTSNESTTEGTNERY